MTAPRLLLRVALVVVALVLQATVVARLPLPGSPPDLVLVVVLAFALAEGPSSGMVVGFAAGCLADLQADHPLGRLALAYVVVARVVGGLAGGDDRSVLRPFLAVLGGAAGALVVYALEGVLLGDTRVSVRALGTGLVSSAPYAVVLVPFVVPLVAALVGRGSDDAGRRVPRPRRRALR